MRCTGIAWLFAWVTAIYLPSAAIALSGLSEPVQASGNFLAAIWRVADDMAPAAKLLLGGLLLLGFAAATRARIRSGLSLPLNALLGAFAMLAVLLVLPADWSRGFGIGLTGARLDPALLPTYLGGGAVAGAVFTFLRAGCARRQADA